MDPVATYVFVDLETSSLPFEDNNRSKITEISLVAVKRVHVLDTQPGATPRVQHKLTFCINPRKYIHPAATETTGLCNDLLEHEPTFDMQVFTTINNFLNVLTKPVCLIAQNGHNFDFPILKNHFEKIQAKLSDNILCADSLHAFYDIENDLNKVNDINIQETSNNKSLDEKHSLRNQKSQSNNSSITETTSPPHEIKEDISIELFPQTNENDEIDCSNEPKSMQAVNEITPKRASKQTSKQAASKKVEHKQITKSNVRRRLFWGNNKKPADSYKLKDVYMRVLNRQAVNAHRAENDCILTLEVAIALGKDFVDWVDNNNCLFSDVNPMRIGVPLGE